MFRAPSTAVSSAVYSLVIAGLAFAALAVAGATLLWEPGHLFPGPAHDGIFDKLRFYRALTTWQDFVAYLISPHNEHRILTTRLVAVADEMFFSGREHTLVVATNILQVAGALGVFVLFFRWIGRGWSLFEAVFVAAVLLLLFVNSSFLYTLIVPFQLEHSIMGSLCLLAAALMAEGSADESSIRKPTLVVILVALAIVATFTLGNAPIILLSAATISIVLRWSAKVTVSLIVLAGLHTAISLAITPRVGSSSVEIVSVFKFLLIYLGSPLLRLDSWPAPFPAFSIHPYLAGAFGAGVLFVGVAFGSWRLVRRGAGGRLAVFGLALLMMIVATGLAAGVSRAQFGILEAANKKYASFAALGWVAVTAILCGLLAEIAPRLRLAPVIAVCVTALPLCALAHQRETLIWGNYVDRMWEVSTAVLSQSNVHAPLEMYTSKEGMREYAGYIQSRRRGLFAQFPVAWGDDIDPFLASRSEAVCRSEVQSLTPVLPGDRVEIFPVDGFPAVAQGWTWLTNDNAPATTIIAVDQNRRVVGVARSTRTSGRAEEWLGQHFHRPLGWLGYVRLLIPGTVEFIALSRDGRSFCRLGGVGNVRTG